MLKQLLLATSLASAQPMMANNQQQLTITPSQRTEYMYAKSYTPINTQTTYTKGIESNRTYYYDSEQIQVIGYTKKFAPFYNATEQDFIDNCEDANIDQEDYPSYHYPQDTYSSTGQTGWLYPGRDSTEAMTDITTAEDYRQYDCFYFDSLAITNNGVAQNTTITFSLRYNFTYDTEINYDNYLRIRTIYTTNPSYYNQTNQNPFQTPQTGSKACLIFTYGINYGGWTNGTYGNDYTIEEETINPTYEEYIEGQYHVNFKSDTRNGNLTTPYKNITKTINLQSQKTTYVYNEVQLIAKKSENYPTRPQITQTLGQQYSNGNSEYDILRNGIDLPTINTTWTSKVVNMDVVDIPGIMFTILGMPFSFISQAFNLTLFPGTPYSINFTNLFLSVIGILVFVFIIKMIMKAVK